MSKHFLLTSKSVAIPFIIVYFITRVLYLLAPITTSYLVPSKPYISKYHNITISKGSDGQKKFYQIEKDLKNTKTVIILDEPTNYLDANKKNKFIHLLQKYKKDHIVILIRSRRIPRL